MATLILDSVCSQLGADPVEFAQARHMMTFPDEKVDGGETCFIDNDGNMLTGLVALFSSLAEQFGLDVSIDDSRLIAAPTFEETEGITAPDFLSGTEELPYTKRDYQISIARKSLCSRRGIIHVGTGGGKTEIAVLIIKWLLDHDYVHRALFVGADSNQMDQAANRLVIRGLPDVGRVGAGYMELDRIVVSATVDTLYSRLKRNDPDMRRFMGDVDIVIFDEVHHIAAVKWITVGSFCQAGFRYGLSATPFDDMHGELTDRDFYLIGLTGPVVASLPSYWLRKRGYLAEPFVLWHRVTGPRMRTYEWHEVYQQGIVEHEAYNSTVISIAKALYDNQFKTLVFVAHKKHGFLLSAALRRIGCSEIVFCHGERTSWRYEGDVFVSAKWTAKDLFDFVQSRERILLIGSPFLDESADLPSINALIMAGGMKKYRRVLQRVGRALRPKIKGTNEAYIFDLYATYHKYLDRHSQERARVYRHDKIPIIKRAEMAAKTGFEIPIRLDYEYGQMDELREQSDEYGAESLNG